MEIGLGLAGPPAAKSCVVQTAVTYGSLESGSVVSLTRYSSCQSYCATRNKLLLSRRRGCGGTGCSIVPSRLRADSSVACFCYVIGDTCDLGACLYTSKQLKSAVIFRFLAGVLARSIACADS